jgi:uroporphyrinogen decarboxylase
MIHVSDDWGAQYGLMFSLELWWKMIYPNHKVTCDAVKMRKGYLSLHSDGNINPVLEGVVKLGYDVLHPFQESDGMDLTLFKANHRQAFTVMGGIDIQRSPDTGNIDRRLAEIKRVVDQFRDGGLMLCTSQFVPSHCPLDDLILTYDLAYEYIRQTT